MRLSQRYDIKRYGDMHAKSYSDLLQANEWKPSIAQSSEVLILQYPSGSRSCVANSWAEARLLWSFLCRHLVCPEELSEVTVPSAQTQFCTACQKPTRQLSSSDTRELPPDPVLYSVSKANKTTVFVAPPENYHQTRFCCLLYTSDAADTAEV